MDVKSIFREATASSPATRSTAWPLAWQQVALGGVLALSAFMNLFRLSKEGDGNLYYAAAVRSMLESWHNFFFVSFDPGGFVTVDKPPLGLWLQTASAEIFGFHGWALLLPQALAGVLSVALLYHLVNRAFGPVAGLIAGLVLALTPITVVTSRNNTMDVTLVLVVLLAAWAVLKAAETGKLGWLLLGAFLVGLGFNTKMLEAYLVLPALYLLYLVASPRRWWTRVGHLALATVVLLVVSLSWAVAVDLTPASQRPYVGSTTDNSELSLAIGYNGLDRVLPGITIFGHTLPGTTRGRGGGGFNGVGGGGRNFRSGTPSQPSESLLQRLRNLFGDGGGRQTGIPGFGASQPGPLRFISQELSGQISWLLPLALLGLVVAAWQVRRRRRTADPAMPMPMDQGAELTSDPGMADEVDPSQRRRRQAVILWGAWTLSMLAFFSYTSRFQPYYLVMLAPGIAALVGIGLVALWRAYRASPWLFWLLPVALVGSGLFEYMILAGYPDWRGRLAPAIFALLGIAALGLVAWRLLPSSRLRLPALLPAGLAALGLLGLLLAPTAWAALPVWNGSGGRPYAGPAPSYGGSGGGGRGRVGGFAFSQPAAQSVPSVDPALLSYLEAHQGSDRFLVAVANAQSAEPFILKTGKPVMALGGFLGSDPILTPNHLAQLVANGTVRYFLLAGVPTSGSGGGRGGRGFGGFGGFGGNQQASDSSWVGQHCSAVPSAQWQSSNGSSGGYGGYGGFGGFGRGGQQLFDCGTSPSPTAPTAAVPSIAS